MCILDQRWHYYCSTFYEREDAAYLPEGNLDTDNSNENYGRLNMYKWMFILFYCGERVALFIILTTDITESGPKPSSAGIGPFANEHHAYVMVYLLYQSPHPSIRTVILPPMRRATRMDIYTSR